MTANTLQILDPSTLGPWDLLNELLNRQRVLTLYALLMLAAMIPTLVLAVVDERTLREVGIWVKPLKFMASTALFSLTTAWFMGLLPQARRNAPVSRAVVWTLVWTSLFEVAYISLQAALGAPSHYNTADPFHAAMFVADGLGRRAADRHAGRPGVADLIGQAVEHGIERGCLGAKQGVQHGGVLEQAVQVHAQHIARRVLPGDAGHDLARHVALGGHGGVLGGLAVVDFVALSTHARERRPDAR
jgi:hypothetical protein